MIRPVHLAVGDTFEIGEPPDLQNGSKPLYGFDRSASSKPSNIWVVEGEKCVVALNNSSLQMTFLTTMLPSPAEAQQVRRAQLDAVTR